MVCKNGICHGKCRCCLILSVTAFAYQSVVKLGINCISLVCFTGNFKSDVTSLIIVISGSSKSNHRKLIHNNCNGGFYTLVILFACRNRNFRLFRRLNILAAHRTVCTACIKCKSNLTGAVSFVASLIRKGKNK